MYTIYCLLYKLSLLYQTMLCASLTISFDFICCIVCVCIECFDNNFLINEVLKNNCFVI